MIKNMHGSGASPSTYVSAARGQPSVIVPVSWGEPAGVLKKDEERGRKRDRACAEKGKGEKARPTSPSPDEEEEDEPKDKRSKRLMTADEIRDFFIMLVPEKHRKKDRWMYEFEPSDVSGHILDSMTQAGIAKGKKRNFRAHIGPGAGGSSEDKLVFDIRFEPKHTHIMYKTIWRTFHRTTWACFEGEWRIVHCGRKLDDVKEFTETPEHCAILIHPARFEGHV